MQMSDNLISRDEVIKAVDRHTKEDGTLDDDISVILEEVKTAFDKEKVHRELIELRNAEICKPDSMNKYDEAQSLGRYGAFLDAIRIVEKGGIE